MDFEALKKEVLDILKKQAKNEHEEHEQIKKSILSAERFYKSFSIEKAGYPVGTIREWKGKKYIKIAPNKWKRKYDKNGKGANISIGKLIKRVEAIDNVKDLAEFVLAHKSRFLDENGKPLDIVDRLRQAADKRIQTLESNNISKNEAKPSVLISYGEKYYPDRKEIVTRLIKDGKNYDVVEKVEYIKNRNGNKDFDYSAYDTDEWERRKKSGESESFSKPKKVSVDDIVYDDKRIENKIKEQIRSLEMTDEERKAEQDAIEAEEKKKKEQEEKKQKTKEENIKDIISNLPKDTLDSINSEIEKYAKGTSDKEEVKRERFRTEYDKDLVKLSDEKGLGTRAVIFSLIDSYYEKKNEKPSVKTIRNKYEQSHSVNGRKKTVILPNGEKIKCHYKLVEAEAPTASHDETNFQKTAGFPSNKDGSTINDRDYEKDTAAQESVIKIASNFNAKALQDAPIVTKDGIVVSGNNRTMSSKLAAKNGTDKSYIDDLKDTIDEYGLDESDLQGFKHPRIILEIDEEHKGDYTTEEFAKYNANDKKSMSPVEKAVKISKVIKPDSIKDIANKIKEFDSLSELYEDKKASNDFVSSLVKNGIIQDVDKAAYIGNDGKLTDGGKEFVETVLAGAVLSEDNIRAMNIEGGKAIRRKLIRGIIPLINNKGEGNEYSFNSELNEAVKIALRVAQGKDNIKSVDDYIQQGSLFGDEKISPITAKLASMITSKGQGSDRVFADKMAELGVGLRESAAGQMDIFCNSCETKEDIMNRILNIQKAIKKALINLFSSIKA